MGNQCCTPADNKDYKEAALDANGLPLPRNKVKSAEEMLLSGELKLKKNNPKFLEA